MSMREKYQSLALADLKEIAKSRGIKGTSGMKKADIIEAMVCLLYTSRIRRWCSPDLREYCNLHLSWDISSFWILVYGKRIKLCGVCPCLLYTSG